VHNPDTAKNLICKFQKFPGTFFYDGRIFDCAAVHKNMARREGTAEYEHKARL
jgi:hypothetical protein